MSVTIMGKMNELGDKLSMTSVREKLTEFGKLNELLKYEPSGGASSDYDFKIWPTNTLFYGTTTGQFGQTDAEANIPAGSLIRFDLTSYANPGASYGKNKISVSSTYWNNDNLNANITLGATTGFLQIENTGELYSSVAMKSPWFMVNGPTTITSSEDGYLSTGVPCIMVTGIEWVKVDEPGLYTHLANNIVDSIYNDFHLKGSFGLFSGGVSVSGTFPSKNKLSSLQMYITAPAKTSKNNNIKVFDRDDANSLNINPQYAGIADPSAGVVMPYLYDIYTVGARYSIECGSNFRYYALSGLN